MNTLVKETTATDYLSIAERVMFKLVREFDQFTKLDFIKLAREQMPLTRAFELIKKSFEQFELAGHIERTGDIIQVGVLPLAVYRSVTKQESFLSCGKHR